MAKSFDKALNLTNICLLISGIRIFRTDNKSKILLTNFLFYFNFLWLHTDVFGELFWIIEGVQIGKSFSELSFIAPCFTICLLATAKLIPLYCYNNVMTEVVEELSLMHPYFDITPLEAKADISKSSAEESVEFKTPIKMIEHSIKFLNFVVRLLFYSSAVVILVFTLLPLLSMAYDYHNKGETELKFPFLIKYFFDPFTTARWPFVYIHQVWSTFIAGFNVFGADTFLYTFCTFVQMYFRILAYQFEHAVSESSLETRKLNMLIGRHQQLIELVEKVEVIFSISTLFNIISSSVLICLSGFNITFLDDSGAVFAFFTFLVMSLSQISLLCLFGDMLMRASTTISDAVYKSTWYAADQRVKKNIFLIIIRAQKPCRLTAAKFANLNLTAFTTILSRSWSYFALLKTMYK